MVSHHQEAVDSSKAIISKTDDTAIERIAQDIIIGQSEEIDLMNQWKEEWYSESTYVSNYMPMMPSLETLSEPNAKKAYLQGMIAHHTMAIVMAQQVLALNPREEVAFFARAVIEVPSREIVEMKQLLTK